jgi:hypothetical protein
MAWENFKLSPRARLYLYGNRLCPIQPFRTGFTEFNENYVPLVLNLFELELDTLDLSVIRELHTARSTSPTERVPA